MNRHKLASRVPAVLALAVLPLLASNAAGASVSRTSDGSTTTLTEVDWNPSGPDGTWQLMVNKAFEQQNPGVQIQRTAESFGQLSTTIGLRLNSPAAPCVIGGAEDWALRPLVQAHLLIPLNKYANEYGWYKNYPTQVLGQVEMTPEGTVMGSGNLYTMPSVLAGPEGIYYDAKLLTKLHLAVPSTLAEFEHDMAVAKANGIVPVELGLEDQVQITVVLYQTLDSFASLATISDFVYGSHHVTVKDTGMLQAAQLVAQWAKDGYFPSDTNGISSGQAQTNFLDGQGLFLPNWAGLGGTAAQNASTGMFVLDGQNGKPAVADSSGTPYGISSHCNDPALAAKYINFMASPAAGKMAVSLGIVPQISVSGATGPNTLIFRSQLATTNAVAEANGYVPYFDGSTPTMDTVVERYGQELVGGRISPTGFVAQLQSAYDTFRQSL
jgi:raffinose/stachyose/melibiose transport system substrate-binding protein